MCFIGNIDVKQFLKQKIRNNPGKIINPEDQVVGTHQGIQFFTVGERIGNNENTNINNEYRNKSKSKIYVASKDRKTNTITVAPENHKALFKKQFEIRNIIYTAEKPKFPLNNIKVRIRHLGQLIPTRITKSKKSNNLIVNLKQSIQGIAEGQSAIIYTKQGIMLGGGEITY